MTNRAIFVKANADAFAVLGVQAWVTSKDTGAIVPTRTIVTIPDPGDHDGIAPRSLDSVWVDLPAGAGSAGDLLSYIDTVDLKLRAFILSRRPDRGALDLRVRWVGVQLALPEGTASVPGAYPNVHWNGSDWVPRP